MTPQVKSDRRREFCVICICLKTPPSIAAPGNSAIGQSAAAISPVVKTSAFRWSLQTGHFDTIVPFLPTRVLKLLTFISGGTQMSKKAAEHHKKAAEHLTHAARHHGEAAKHHEGGHHEKAAHHAHTARAHVIHARGHAEEAVKAHAEEHGKK
jgi:hypothetical protein